MSLALYRRYRPQTFSDVVGQENITKMLASQVREGSVAHAYLFTGTRGTGKTSCARILSRAVNCLNPVDGEPCNECEVCRGLIENSLTDVIEIDAASNSGVENIRQMREEVDFIPVLAKYKVYIIDEVHMLSNSAFNALLKTLEEPPSHVIFILATTELHKIPATILSRCQRFDFGRIPSRIIYDRLQQILKSENKVLSDASVELIANLGDGSMRDAISILDKVSELGSEEEIEQTLGVVGKNAIYGILENVAEKDIAAIYEMIAELYAASKDMGVLCSELLRELRNVLIVKTVKNYEKLIDCTEKDGAKLKKIAAALSSEQILYAMSNLQSTVSVLSKSGDKRTDVELCLLKIVSPKLCDDYPAVLARLEQLEKKFDGAVAVQPSDELPKKAVKQKPVKQKAEFVPDAVVTEPIDAADIPDDVKLFEGVDAELVSEKASDSEYRQFLLWDDVYDALKSSDRYLALTLRNMCSAVCKDKELIVLCATEDDYDLVKTPDSVAQINAALKSIRMPDYTVTVKIGKISDYIGTSDTYDSIESNELFHFED